MLGSSVFIHTRFSIYSIYDPSHDLLCLQFYYWETGLLRCKYLKEKVQTQRQSNDSLTIKHLKCLVVQVCSVLLSFNHYIYHILSFIISTTYSHEPLIDQFISPYKIPLLTSLSTVKNHNGNLFVIRSKIYVRM